MSYGEILHLILIVLLLANLYFIESRRRRDQKIKTKLISARRHIGRDNPVAVDQINDVLEQL